MSENGGGDEIHDFLSYGPPAAIFQKSLIENQHRRKSEREMGGTLQILGSHPICMWHFRVI